MKKLYFLIGYPASGKTTLAKRMKAEMNCDYVSTDEIHDELFNAGLKYREICKKIYKKTVMEIIQKGMGGKDIVLDTYKPYKQERAIILEKIPDTYEKVAVIMETPLDECVKRFYKRREHSKSGHLYFEEENIDIPTLGEFDRIISESEVYEMMIGLNSTKKSLGAMCEKFFNKIFA